MFSCRSCCPPPTGGEDLQPCRFSSLSKFATLKCVSQRLRSPCAFEEKTIETNEVRADRVEEEERDENITAEKVMEEKNYVKTTRLCQFFNIC